MDNASPENPSSSNTFCTLFTLILGKQLRISIVDRTAFSNMMFRVSNDLNALDASLHTVSLRGLGQDFRLNLVLKGP